MKRSHLSGLGFGVASGIIMPLGLIVGLYSGTHSAAVIVGGILTIAIADAFADSLGVHISKEADHSYSSKEIWEATATTFISKFGLAAIFTIPFLLFSVATAVLVSVIWGIVLLSLFSFFIAKNRGGNACLAIVEHLGIAFFVILITYYLPPIVKTFVG
jgi:VIT1/CCC1 family predicted Fe2+/Mn2+ transporter